MEAIKKRTISIEGLVCSGCEAKIEEEIRKLGGITHIKADHKNKILSLEYNLLSITMKDIDEKIVDLGYKLPQSGYEKAQRNIIYRTEQNELDRYMGITNPSCSGCNVQGCSGNDATEGSEEDDID